MNLIAFDPYANPSLAASANVEIVDSLDELLEQADFLTLHTPLIASTKGMIGDTELAKMKKTARILNVARGGMIDETALLSALEAGTIAGAGIDVFTAEPPIKDDAASKLIAHPKVVATPHLGASTAEAQENVSIDVCTQVLSILSGQLPRSAGETPTTFYVHNISRLTSSQSMLPSSFLRSTAPSRLSSRSSKRWVRSILNTSLHHGAAPQQPGPASTLLTREP